MKERISLYARSLVDIKKRKGVLFSFLFLWALDFFSKYLLFFHVSPWNLGEGSGQIVQGFMGIDLFLSFVFNKGCAFGLLAQFQPWLLVLRVGIVLWLFSLLFSKTTSSISSYFYALILGGAIGNITDFFVYGHVIDFLHFRFLGHSFPVFNIADAAICIGVAGLIIQSFKENQAKNRARK